MQDAGILMKTIRAVYTRWGPGHAAVSPCILNSRMARRKLLAVCLLSKVLSQEAISEMKADSAEIVNGSPNVQQPIHGITKDQQWKWGTGST